MGLLCLACAGLSTPEAAAPPTPEEKYQAWRKEGDRPERPARPEGAFGDFQFFSVRGTQGQATDRVAISPTTMLTAEKPGDWGALLRTGRVEDVHDWLGWLEDRVEIAPGDLDARRPPLAAYYAPPMRATEGDTTRFQGWYAAYPTGSFVRLTVVAGPDHAVAFTHESLDELLAGTP